MSQSMSVPRAAGPRIRGAIPEPGERVPPLAWPTVSLFVGSVALWGLATWAVLSGAVTPWVTIPVHASVTFLVFTVLHDASHYSISSRRWVNQLFGRLAMPFVVAYASYPLFTYIHIQHHRFANEHANTDPDHWTSEGPWWQLPFRWLTIDLAYGRYFFANRRRRSRADVIETVACFTGFAALVVVAGLTGWLWELALVYLIPQRIGLVVLAWWFDWLPHHGLKRTQRENRYQATRIRVGLEWLMTPLMLSQNYHLVHHLHPAIPFYRYLRAWRNNEEGYLQHDPEMATVFGRRISADQYRSLRELDSSFAQMRRSGSRRPPPLPTPAFTASRSTGSSARPRTAWRSPSPCPRSSSPISGSSPDSTSRYVQTTAARGCVATTPSALRLCRASCGSGSSASPTAPSRAGPPSTCEPATSWRS
jgi:fatty acid desaturase